MKAISLSQPWASLIAHDYKRIETRSWMTSYRGPLAIHASKTFPEAARLVCETQPFRSVLWDMGYERAAELPVGVVIATCILQAVIPVERANGVLPPVNSLEWRFGDFSEGRYLWLLSGVKQLDTPVPVRGTLGLWDWEP